MNFTYPQSSIILAALRIMQNHIEEDGPESISHMPHFDDVPVPTSEEIDTLCDLLNSSNLSEIQTPRTLNIERPTSNIEANTSSFNVPCSMLDVQCSIAATPPLEELSILLSAAAFLADSEPDDDHPDPAGEVLEMVREASLMLDRLPRVYHAAPALRNALDRLLTETVDMDINEGIFLTDSEAAARAQALSAIAACEPDEDPSNIECTCHLKENFTGPVPHCCPRHDGDYSSFLASHNCD